MIDKNKNRLKRQQIQSIASQIIISDVYQLQTLTNTMNDYHEENNTSSLRALHNPSLNKPSEVDNKGDDKNLADVESQLAPLLITQNFCHDKTREGNKTQSILYILRTDII